MPIDTGGSAYLQVLSASAIQKHKNGEEDAEWQLSLENWKLETITKKAKFNTFIENLPAAVEPNELVLFIRASVTVTDNFLVVQKKNFPERNLLRSVFKMEGIERHIFFFTDEYTLKLTEYDNDSSYTPLDPSLMKGVTLYRISCNANDRIPIDKIKAAASNKPLSAIEFYRELNNSVGGGQSEMRIAMVPSGKRGNSVGKTPAGTGRSKKDYVLWLVPDREKQVEQPKAKADSTVIKEICHSMKDTVYIDVCKEVKERKKMVIKATVEDYIKSRANEFKRKIERNEAIGKIWLFVVAHGSSDSGIILPKSEGISIQELANPLCEGELSDITKILVIDACRGDWPPGPKSQPDTKCDSKLGLLFRNEKEDTTGTAGSQDPWDVSRMKKCVTLFGSVPGFKSWETKGSIMFKAMLNAVKELTEPEEVHAFVQRIQYWINDYDQKYYQKTEGTTSREDSKRLNEQQNLEPDSRVVQVTCAAMFPDMDMKIEPAPKQPDSDEANGTSSEDTTEKKKEVTDLINADPDRQASASSANLKISQTHSVTRSSNTSREYVVPKPREPEPSKPREPELPEQREPEPREPEPPEPREPEPPKPRELEPPKPDNNVGDN